ncbi:MAG: hypothetical protein J6O90_01290, partial [Candidatus Methanomethylophilaceae archaeon]|nr:hypothetical protein [Candidatus Methanomethylophilaceae archaeon]
DIDIQTMNAGSEVAYYRIGNADVTAAITGDRLDNLDVDLDSFEGAVTIDISNIILDCGSVTYDPVTERFGSAEVRVSGKSADPYSDLDTVEGTITDISSTPDWECTFDSHDLTYTLRDGASVRDTVTVSGDAVSETLEVSGTVNYETVNGISSIFALMTANATAGRHIDLRTGGGHLVMSSFDDSRYSVAEGDVYLDGVYWKGDLSVFVYTLNGAYLILHSNGDMGIEAKPGYTLDPSTYSGFSVDGGKVVFDETKITDGKLYLEAVCIGDTYRLTLDGSTSDVVYGSMVTLKVPPEVLWIVDSEEKVYGSIRDGEWEYIYSFLGDLELRSIRGEEVIVSPEDVPKASSNAFYFDLPENGEVVTVEAPSGLFFTVTDPGSFSGSRAMISHTETVYNGYRAYEIKANGHITVVFPVKDLDTVLYHVVNGVPVEMNTIPLGGQDQAFLMADLSSFSIYYLTEPAPPVPPGPESQDDAPESLAVILAAIVIVLSLVLMLSWKRK